MKYVFYFIILYSFIINLQFSPSEEVKIINSLAKETISLKNRVLNKHSIIEVEANLTKITDIQNELDKKESLYTQEEYNNKFYKVFDELKEFKNNVKQYNLSKRKLFEAKKTSKVNSPQLTNNNLLKIERDYLDLRNKLLTSNLDIDAIEFSNIISNNPKQINKELIKKVLMTFFLIVLIIVFSFKDSYSSIKYTIKSLVKLAQSYNVQTETTLSNTSTAHDSEILNYISAIAYKLKSSIQNIYGLDELIKTTNLNEKQSIYFDSIYEETHSLNNILTDLIDYSRLKTNNSPTKNSRIHPQESFKNILEQFVPLATKKGISFNYKLSKNLPNNIILDIEGIEKVLKSTISNSIKFTNTGSVTVLVETKNITDTLTDLKIQITDTGQGIEKDKLDNIFNFNVKQVKEAKSDTGLGLVVSNLIIQNMNGNINIDSEINKGTIITIHLKAQYENTISKKINDRKLNILLAEDEKINQKIITRYLEKNGHKVTIANDGQEAINQCKAKDFDIILMDILMPVKNGYEATQEILNNNNKPPLIVALTGMDSQEDFDKCLSYGMNECLSKPVNKDVLQNTLMGLVDTKDAA